MLHISNKEPPKPYSNYYPRALSIQIVPTLGSKVYIYYLLWAFWSPWGKAPTLTEFRLVDYVGFGRRA